VGIMTHDKPFVKVIWHDAADNGHTWVPAEDIQSFTEEITEVTSWGWLVCGSRKAKYIALAADYIKDGTYGRVTKIPAGMIESIEEFKQS
jgi:hypothetical protein